MVSSAMPKVPLPSSRLGPGDMAGDTLDLGIVKAVDRDFVIRREQPEFRVDGACGFRAPAG
jgi:hypothetical protein